MHSNTKAVVARRRECWWEVHRQRVRLIWQLESDDCRSQSLGLTSQQSSVLQLDSREALSMEYRVCTS